MNTKKRTSGIYAPEYYKKFKCTADKCSHSCCIGWEICIDEETLEKYKQNPETIGTTQLCDGCVSFKLTDDHRCPHLNSSGLCKLIISHGEEYLSDICRNHPRFFNAVGKGVTEAGLGIVCEEACRLMLENDKPFTLCKVDEFDGDADTLCGSLPLSFDPLEQRDIIIGKIESGKSSFTDTVQALENDFALSPIYSLSLDSLAERFLSLEILDPNWQELLSSAQNYSLPTADISLFDLYFCRLLTYFVYRHVSASQSYDNLRARLAFALLSVEMIRYLFERQESISLDTLKAISRAYSEEIEYSENNTDELIFYFESRL